MEWSSKMMIHRRIRKTYLKIRTLFHNEDCECDLCIKESLIGRCGMGDKYFPKFSSKVYYTNKLILFPIYDFWVWLGSINIFLPFFPYRLYKWWGNRMWFGYTFYDRYEKLEEVKKKLNDSMLKVSKKYPHMFNGEE